MRPEDLSISPNDTGIVNAGSDILHKVGEKLTEAFLDPVVVVTDPFVVGVEVVVWLSQQAARLLTSNTNSHVSWLGTPPTKLRVLYIE